MSETAVGELAEVYAFRVLPSDSVATNPDIRFAVEEFVPAENFKLSKDYLSRLSWHDLDGLQKQRRSPRWRKRGQGGIGTL